MNAQTHHNSPVKLIVTSLFSPSFLDTPAEMNIARLYTSLFILLSKNTFSPLISTSSPV